MQKIRSLLLAICVGGLSINVYAAPRDLHVPKRVAAPKIQYAANNLLDAAVEITLSINPGGQTNFVVRPSQTVTGSFAVEMSSQDYHVAVSVSRSSATIASCSLTVPSKDQRPSNDLDLLISHPNSRPAVIPTSSSPTLPSGPPVPSTPPTQDVGCRLMLTQKY